jgi:hypothetical protein
MVPATASPISASATFLGGASGHWSITYTGGPAGSYLQSLTITLPGGAFFDPTSASPGFLTSAWQVVSGGAATGFIGWPPADGAATLALSFTDFGPGETFTFDLDADNAATLQDCTGLTGAAKGACNSGNATASAAAEFLSGAEMTGALAIWSFGGAGYQPVTLSGWFSETGPVHASTTVTGDITGILDAAGDATAVPEPGPVALVGLGLAAVGLVRRRQRTD